MQSRRGKELMEAGRYAEAAAVYRELVKAVPGNAGLLLNLGMALHLAGRDADAVPPLQAALKRQPDLVPASMMLGAANLRLGRPAAAVAPLQKVLSLQPDNRDARGMLAEALVALGRHAEAEPHLRRIADGAPRDPAAWFDLGRAYDTLAGQAFEDLLRKDPESPFTLALAGEARLEQGQPAAAFRLFREALARGAGPRGLHAGLARVYRDTGHADWAAVEERRERQLPPPDCARARLECAFAAGKLQDVLAGARPPRSTEAAYWVVRAYGALAARAFDRLAALPPSAVSHEWKAETHRSARRFAESAEEWRRAIALAPGDPRLAVELAVTLRMAQDLAGAERVLLDVVRRAPDAAEPNYLLGEVLLARQDHARAIPYLEKAVRLDSAPPQGHGALGRAYAAAGRPREAIPHLERAVEADEDGTLRLQLARAYQATGQAERARAALAEYEKARAAARAGAEPEAPEAGILPPDGGSS
jgi:predicted Zn-dependent protease